MSNKIYVGKIQSGKSKKIFSTVENAINLGENIIIFDAKEEYISNFNESLKSNNYKRYVINFNNFEKSDCFNPLIYPYNLYKKRKKDEAYAAIEKIGRNIFNDNNNMDSFWINSATHLFIGLCLGLFEDATEEEINFGSVWKMLSYFDERYGVSDYVSKYVKTKNENDAIYKTLSSIIFSPTDTKGGILSTAREKIQKYVNRNNLLQIISQSNIDYDKLFNQKTAIIIIPNKQTPEVNSMLVAILEQLIDILVDKNLKSNIILDDFDMIDKLNNLENNLSYGYAKNIDYIIATRSKDLLFNKYSQYLESLADIIICDEQYEIKKENINLIDFPELKIIDINIFDLKKYISKIDEANYSDIIQEDIEVKDLLKNINNKLKELD